MTTTPQTLTPADVLHGLARACIAENRHDFPVYTIWNAICPFIPENRHLDAVIRMADAVHPQWQRFVPENVQSEPRGSKLSNT